MRQDYFDHIYWGREQRFGALVLISHCFSAERFCFNCAFFTCQILIGSHHLFYYNQRTLRSTSYSLNLYFNQKKKRICIAVNYFSIRTVETYIYKCIYVRLCIQAYPSLILSHSFRKNSNQNEKWRIKTVSLFMGVLGRSFFGAKCCLLMNLISYKKFMKLCMPDINR